MLLAAAGFEDPKTMEAPAEAIEVVQLCKNLPLALGIAGRLVKGMSVGSDWLGVAAGRTPTFLPLATDTLLRTLMGYSVSIHPISDLSGPAACIPTSYADARCVDAVIVSQAVLRDEFGGDDAEASSMADKVIMASLANIRGATKQQVVHLFNAFALVPEDTFCPLEIMTILYEAEVLAQQTVAAGLPPPTSTAIAQSKPPSRLLIRKWLKILTNRSLVLGTVDRPVQIRNVYCVHRESAREH